MRIANGAGTSIGTGITAWGSHTSKLNVSFNLHFVKQFRPLVSYMPSYVVT
jgi:hypothetical protein